MKDGRTLVRVIVTDKVGSDTFWAFVMVKRTFSKYEGCWQSLRICRAMKIGIRNILTRIQAKLRCLEYKIDLCILVVLYTKTTS